MTVLPHFSTVYCLKFGGNKFYQLFVTHFIGGGFCCFTVFKLGRSGQVMYKLLLRLACSCYMHMRGIYHMRGYFLKKLGLGRFFMVVGILFTGIRGRNFLLLRFHFLLSLRGGYPSKRRIVFDCSCYYLVEAVQ